MNVLTQLPPSAVTPTIDLNADGVHHGYLSVPWSHDESAWGTIRLPLTVARNGDGPTALLVGGNHGDEYEGPIALLNLARSLKAEEISGRIIILPCLNLPAVKAGRRTSPVDSGNMNRSFPGDPLGTPTQKIADYVARYLIPIAGHVLDMHSGGKTLDLLPFAACHELDDKALQKRCQDAVAAFGAPYSLVMRELDDRGMLDTEVEQAGKVLVTTELGGGGTATAVSIRIAERGTRNLLRHVGILPGDPEPADSVPLMMPETDAHMVSDDAGLLEMTVDLGERFEKGQMLARVHPFERAGGRPAVYEAPRDGILLGRHHPGIINPGDCLAAIAVAPDA